MRALCILLIAFTAAAQQKRTLLPSPFGPANALVSPDFSHAIYGTADTSELYLEDTRTHASKLILKATVQTMTFAWSPDSTAFIANDRALSDLEIPYIFDVKTLNKLDLRGPVFAADPGAKQRFDGNGYIRVFAAIQWLDNQHVELQLAGHTVGTMLANGTIKSADCFDLRYRVTRQGKVEKLSELVVPVDSKSCQY